MTFLLNPLGLIGLISLPVIIILHLLRERQRRYVVSNLDLWSFLDTQVRGPRTRRIPITRLLLLDLLIAALISLAWAQPSLAIDLPGERAKHLVILLDNSTSMLANEGASSRFTQAQAAVARLVDEAGAGSVVTLLTFGRQARIIVDSRQLSDPGTLSALILALHAGETGGSAPALRAALAMGQASLDRKLPAEFHIFTDGNFALDAAGAPFAYPQQWHWIGSPEDNQAVIDLNTTLVEVGRLHVFTRIANYADRAVIRTAVLRVDGRQVDQADINLPANAAVARIWQMNIPTDAAEITVTLEGRDALPEDDQAASGLQLGREMRVALIAENPSVLQKAVQAVPNVNLQIFTPQDYLDGAGGVKSSRFDLTIFRGFVPPEWPLGEALLVEPPADNSSPAAPSGSPSFMVESGERIPADAPVQTPNRSPIVDGIDFSGVRWSRAWRLQNLPPGFLRLLQVGETPLLLRGVISSPGGSSPARLTILLADLTQGNFTKHPAYPILMANLVDQARTAPLPPSFKTGEALVLPAPGSYAAIQVVNPAQDTERWQSRWPAEWQNSLQAGVYRFDLTGVDGERTSISVAANAGDESESDLRMRDWNRAVELAPAGAGLPVQDDSKFNLWPWLLGAAILVLIAEAVLAWRS